MAPSASALVPHGDYVPGATEKCGVCHDPHEAGSERQIFRKVGQTGGQTALCLDCHDGTGADSNVKDSEADSFALSSGHSLEDTQGPVPPADFTDGCSGCHGVHASPVDNHLLPRAEIASAAVPGRGNVWCFACHDDANRWFSTKYGRDYPTTGTVERDPSGYPVTGPYPGATAYSNSAANPHASIPASSALDRQQGDCLYCHAAHRGMNAYDGLRGTFRPASSFTLALDQASGLFAAACLECHGGVAPSYLATVPADIRMHITTATPTAGHRVFTPGGTLPTGAPLPCYDCHNPHGSERGNASLLSDALGASLDTSTAPGVRHLCLSCHSTSDDRVWESTVSTYLAVQPDQTIEGLRRDGYVDGVWRNFLELHDVPGHASTDEQSCYDCHGSDYAPGGSNVHNPYSHGGNAGGGGTGDDCAFCHGTSGSHNTHLSALDKKCAELACTDCHLADDFPYFKSGVDADSSGHVDLAETSVCDACHSPDGAYDGVTSVGGSVGAKDNWDTRVYEADDLQTGKEKWCLGCHDDQGSYSRADGTGVTAPNIAGDNATYGFLVTGHKMDCLNCHDAGRRHIDHEHRTYAIDEAASYAVVNPYNDSYRLGDVDGRPALDIPTRGWITYDNSDFALCFKCHEEFDVMGKNADSFDRGRTNFFNATSGQNSHSYHILRFTSEGDSDHDGSIDSNFTCPMCHNVHGSANQAMVNRGELMSTPGTTDAMPAFNMSYILPGNGSAVVRYTPLLPSAGDYEVFVRWPSVNGRNEISRAASNAKYTIVSAAGLQTDVVTRDLRYSSSDWRSFGTYYFAGGSEYVELTSLGVDGTIFADGVRFVNVGTGEEVTMDNEQAAFLPSMTDWRFVTNQFGAFQSDHREYAPISSTTATAADSLAGTGPGSGGPGNNRICAACHYSPVWKRTPLRLPTIIPFTYSEPVTADGNVDLLFGAWVKVPSGTLQSVTIDLSVIGGGRSQTLYNDGTHGDRVAGDNEYSFMYRIPADAPSGANEFKARIVTSEGEDEDDLKVRFIKDGEIYWDNDSGDGLWSTPANWSTDTLPQAGDRVVFNQTSSTNARADTIPGGLEYLSVNPGYMATLTLGRNLNSGTKTLDLAGDLKAYSGKVVLEGDTSTVNAPSGGTEVKPHGAGLTVNARNIVVGPGGHISADGQGFGPMTGPGASSVNWASGGSHGGFGTSTDAIRDTFPYGSITSPTALGSGGATVASGGSGGGAIKLVASDTVSVRGVVSAAGVNRDGGGSGGSVWIIADRISGEGTISARGGYNAFRLGGGGRISLHWSSGGYDFDGLITAEGAGGATNGSLWVSAEGTANAWAEMWNASRPVNSIVAIPPGEYYLDGLRILSGANLECLGDRTAINEPSGGTVSKPNGAGVTIHSNEVAIDAGGVLSADLMGFYPQQGPGAAVGASQGGCYGGYGMGVDSQRRNFPYGVALTPTALGSGGGSANGGPGGGAIKLDVTGTVTVDGVLSAVGQGCKMSGAGSGGSLWIDADTIAGSGTINANGGDDYWGTGFSGSGGRIRLDWQAGNYLFNGIVKAEGPDGATNGTLWVDTDGGSNPWNEMWNAARHVRGSVALPSGAYNIPELHIDEGVSLDCQGDPAVTNEASGGTPSKPHGQGVTINSDSVTIAPSASLNADLQGFRPQAGPGGSLDWGGSYGGYGNHIDGWKRGALYGSYAQPTALGTGGGAFATNGMGGGALRLDVTGSVVVNGTLSANGEAVKGGGGSGGSIWVTADSIDGTGTISAQGPLRWASAYSGGGGRISLQWNAGKLSFTGPIKADGVGSGATNGTLWVDAVGSPNPWDELWNASRPMGGSVALPCGSYDIAELTIPSGVRLDVQGDEGVSGPDGAGVTINSDNINVRPGAAIRGDSLGFRQRRGPGAATSGVLGASHGGMGSSGAPTYGSAVLPTALGSGGSDAANGGPGGSAVKLNVEETLTVNGAISANGQGTSGGGGAGGSVLVFADAIEGTGTISANGGANGGGGGRVAVHYNTNSTSLAGLYAGGGGGTSVGASGTVVFAGDADGMYASLKSVVASDASGGGAGIQAGDRVVVRFNGPTAGTPITALNIDLALPLSNLHSWLDGFGQIQLATWSTTAYANDTLTIFLSSTGSPPSVAPGDTVTLTGLIRDDRGNAPTGALPLSGTFDSIPAGTVAFWPMDEGSGETAVDATGLGNDGGLKPNYSIDSPSWVSGRYASGLSFDGSNDFVDAGNQPAMNPAWREPFSVEAWVKFSSGTSFNNTQMMVDKIQNSGAYRGWQVYKSNTNRITFMLVDDWGATRYISRGTSSAVVPDTWYNVVATYDGGTTGSAIELRLNGVVDQGSPVDGSNAAAMTTIANGENLKMGLRGLNTYQFKGSLDAVLVKRPNY